MPKVVLWGEADHGYTVDDEGETVYAVSNRALPQRKQQRALKVLEILAFGFMDYVARESVCDRGYFVYPVTPEHGRLWLAEVGRRGGTRTSEQKASSSARNGRRHRAASAR
jgi:hypothetical protein